MKIFFFKILFFVSITLFAQDSVNINGYNVFHYSNGQIASEGFLKEGQPDGYWKNYYENGQLKSEGNRENFLLDSTWIFYSDSGNISLKINYKEGKKNGIRTTINKSEIIEENFENDIKEGYTNYYYANGNLKKKVFYANGREEGEAREYSEDGTIITLIEYKRGYIINSENINRYRTQQKHGIWKTFYENENIKEEGTYYFGKKDGYFKTYDVNGNLLTIKKFDNDQEIIDAPELSTYEIRTDYYSNGKVKVIGSYKDGVPDGIRRDFDENGNVLQAYVFVKGIIVGEGIVDNTGSKQGMWKEFYDAGELMAEGEYVNGLRNGKWTYYFANGIIEQTGIYVNGKPDKIWKWYYESGNIRREENFIKGIPDGIITEYSDTGRIILYGNYLDGEEEGEWIYEVGDDKIIGSYLYGKKEGMWKHYCNGLLYYEGNYLDGSEDGLHILYWNNGKIKSKGKYFAGKKEGEWIFNNYDGTRLLTLYFEDGVEIKIDGYLIDTEPER